MYLCVCLCAHMHVCVCVCMCVCMCVCVWHSLHAQITQKALDPVFLLPDQRQLSWAPLPARSSTSSPWAPSASAPPSCWTWPRAAPSWHAPMWLATPPPPPPWAVAAAAPLVLLDRPPRRLEPRGLWPPPVVTPLLPTLLKVRGVVAPASLLCS